MLEREQKKERKMAKNALKSHKKMIIKKKSDSTRLDREEKFGRLRKGWITSQNSNSILKVASCGYNPPLHQPKKYPLQKITKS